MLRTTKKRGREHNNNNSTVSKRVLLMPPDQELWINKHKPVTAESLAVHTKKVRRPWNCNKTSRVSNPYANPAFLIDAYQPDSIE
jgi:hypothetical protein